MMSGRRKAVQKASIWPVVPNSMANTCCRASPSSRLATVPPITIAADQAKVLAAGASAVRLRTCFRTLTLSCSFAEPGHRLFRHLDGAELDVANLGAVVVAAAGGHQVVLPRQIQEAGAHLRQMVGVVDLDALEAGIHQLAERLLRGPVA